MKCSNIKFISSGYHSIASQKWIYPKHTSGANELIYVTNGTLHICEDYNEFHIKPDTVLWLEKEHIHYGLAPSEEPLSFMRLIFSSDENEEIIPNDATVTLRKVTIPRNPDKLKLLWDELNSSIMLPECTTVIQDYYARLLLMELSIYGASCDNSFNFQQIISDWIKNEAPSGIRVSAVASHFGYSEDYITKIFKSFYSKGIKKYIDAVRINRIKNDLCRTDLPLSVIAKRHCFKSSEALYKFFKANTGLTANSVKKMHIEYPEYSQIANLNNGR